MIALFWKLKSILAVTCVFVAATGMAAGQSARLDPLFERLKSVDAVDAPALEAKIRQEWSKKRISSGRFAAVSGKDRH